jgi:hypothetical protein
MMIVPEVANTPPTLWQREIRRRGSGPHLTPASGGALPQRVRAAHAGMHVGQAAAIGVSGNLPPEVVLRSAMKAPASSAMTLVTKTYRTVDLIVSCSPFAIHQNLDGGASDPLEDHHDIVPVNIVNGSLAPKCFRGRVSGDK